MKPKDMSSRSIIWRNFFDGITQRRSFLWWSDMQDDVDQGLVWVWTQVLFVYLWLSMHSTSTSSIPAGRRRTKLNLPLTMIQGFAKRWRGHDGKLKERKYQSNQLDKQFTNQQLVIQWILSKALNICSEITKSFVLFYYIFLFGSLR